MTIMISISCVNGSLRTLETDDIHEARGFLAQEDHEGSAVTVSIESSDSDEAYKLLEAL